MVKTNISAPFWSQVCQFLLREFVLERGCMVGLTGPGLHPMLVAQKHVSLTSRYLKSQMLKLYMKKNYETD